jgi:hypothetical protein
VITRRTFLGTAGALALGHGVNLDAQEIARGAFRAEGGGGCTELEPFPRDLDGSPSQAFEQSIQSAAKNPANLKALGLPVTTAPQAAASALMGSAGAPPAAAAAAAQPLTVNGQAGLTLAQFAATDIDELNAKPDEEVLVPRLALMRAKLWDRQAGVRIFVGRTSNSVLREAINEAIDIWASYIDMRLRRSESPSADIVVGYRYPGFFSAVGTDSRVQQFRSQYGGQSLNIQDNVSGYDRERYRGVALHELGHALGAIHEHQSPSGDIPWNRTELYRYYGRPPNNWSREQVNFQIVNKYNTDIVNASEYDSASIMLYPVLEELLDKSVPDYRGYITGWNYQLSSCDKSFMQGNYGVGSAGEFKCTPDEPTEPPEEFEPPTSEEGEVPSGDGRVRPSSARRLTLGSRISARIDRYAERHIYRLEVADSDDYVIETIEDNPSINMRLELFGSSNLDRPFAVASYGGRRVLNAYISKRLTRGTYYVRAGHRNRWGTGRYTIYFHKK